MQIIWIVLFPWKLVIMFEVSIDDVTYSGVLEIPVSIANEENTIYMRFTPTEVGNLDGTAGI